MPIPAAELRAFISSHRRLLGLAAALGLAATLPACDEPPALADDTAESQEAEDPAGTLPPIPQLTAEELAQLQAEATIAVLPVGDAGRVTIVGPPDGSILAYQVGGGLADEALRQLVDEQQASPAEVFLALAEPGATIPEVLLADHRARAARDPLVEPQPRELTYGLPRALELDNLGCHDGSGDPISFNSWVSDWTARFNFVNFTLPNRTTARNQADGATGYSLPPDAQGSVMSACNATLNDMAVTYWAYVLTSPPSLQLLSGANLGEFDAVHFYLAGYPFMTFMQVHHTHPEPDTYVAIGRCNGGC